MVKLYHRKETVMGFGGRLRMVRKAKLLSMEKLAKQVGLSTMSISKYENNKMNPDSTMLLKLAIALDVNVEFFFRERFPSNRRASEDRAGHRYCNPYSQADVVDLWSPYEAAPFSDLLAVNEPRELLKLGFPT